MSASLLVEYGEVVASEAKPDSNGTRLEISLEDLQTLRTHSRQLEARINNLKHSDQLTSSDREDIHRAEEACSLFSGHIDQLWCHIPTRSKPTAGSAAVATKVFAVPELLELILMQLPARSILSAQRVGREWRDAVNGSFILKTELGLVANANLMPYMPFPGEDDDASFPGLSVNIDYAWESYTDGWAETVKPETSNKVSVTGSWQIDGPWLGTRCHSMQLCQPPLKHVALSRGPSAATPYMSWRERNYTLTVECRDGDTAGDLFDAVRLDTKFSWDSIVIINGVIALNSEHPIMKERSKAHESAKKCVAAKERRRAKRRAQHEARYPDDDYYSSDDRSNSNRSDSDIDA